LRRNACWQAVWIAKTSAVVAALAMRLPPPVYKTATVPTSLMAAIVMPKFHSIGVMILRWLLLSPVLQNRCIILVERVVIPMNYPEFRD